MHFVWQSMPMEHHAAAEHLQVIRTLMERSAVYRRTLAPIMLYVGCAGVAAGAAGLALGIEGGRPFGAWWLGAALVALAGAFAIARRQAMHDGEPFWSPPTLRVVQAILPPLAAGLVLSLAMLASPAPDAFWQFVLPNALLYGCAAHAAGFFMPRGMKLFGWMVIALAGLTATGMALLGLQADVRVGHLMMGTLFGLVHLAYGGYLYATEPRKSAA
jgi:hypothetical protein